ncbi:hypothetical protein F4774DRAFT_429721 [Daldinia eschscholtzii]|nr:hypothetical protein F4774DRAFT_429721 [Daldinia eschscholtzii]
MRCLHEYLTRFSISLISLEYFLLSPYPQLPSKHMCSFLNPFILQRIPPSDPLPPFLLLLSELTSRDYSLAAQPRGGPMSSNIVIPPPISRIIYEVPPPHIYCLLHPTRDAPGPPNRPLPKPPVRPKYAIDGSVILYPTTILRPVTILHPTLPMEPSVPASQVPLAPNAVLLRRIA